jgi:hypothetical protein
MITKKIEITITAESKEELAMKEKALRVIAEKLSAKEQDRLRQIVLYEPSLMEAARKFMRL